jgi:hypothetical protein
MTLPPGVKIAREKLKQAHGDFMRAIRVRQRADEEASNARYHYHASHAHGHDADRIRATLGAFTNATARVSEVAAKVDACRVALQDARRAALEADLEYERTKRGDA